MNSVCVKHVRTSTNKNKCPIYSISWTPNGRRLITAASSGEFTLWNGLTFNFETILQAHDTHIKAMQWSHNEEWLLTGDDLGMVKYWQANMNDVNVFQAHKEAVRGLSLCPSDKKFVSCSADNTVRIWDFQMCKEERVLRGHSGEVKCVEWHPTKSLVMSGSRDSQQPLKIWDPKSGECISTMYVHKNSIHDVKINQNGNWFLTASRDHTIKLFDLRNLKEEIQVFRGHRKDVNRVAWHPFHEDLFASASYDGVLKYWMAGTEMEVGSIDDAHDGSIWSIDWHPMGHILASASTDSTTKFWTRNRPGDNLTDNQQVDHTGSVIKITDVNKNADEELKDIIERGQKIVHHEDIDFQKLSSSNETSVQENQLTMSVIPGLLENTTYDDNSYEENQEMEKVINSKDYENKIIPEPFSLKWEEKNKTPAGYITFENPQTNFISTQPLPQMHQPISGLSIPNMLVGMTYQKPVQINNLDLNTVNNSQNINQFPQIATQSQNPFQTINCQHQINPQNVWNNTLHMYPGNYSTTNSVKEQNLLSNLYNPLITYQKVFEPTEGFKNVSQFNQQNLRPLCNPPKNFQRIEGLMNDPQMLHQMNINKLPNSQINIQQNLQWNMNPTNCTQQLHLVSGQGFMNNPQLSIINQNNPYPYNERNRLMNMHSLKRNFQQVENTASEFNFRNQTHFNNEFSNLQYNNCNNNISYNNNNNNNNQTSQYQNQSPNQRQFNHSFGNQITPQRNFIHENSFDTIQHIDQRNPRNNQQQNFDQRFNFQQNIPPPTEFCRYNGENPFETQNSTGTFKGFIPLSFSDGEPLNKRNKQHQELRN